jgi:hypothetical protein
MIIIMSTKKQALVYRQFMIFSFQMLGFTINEEKSFLIPSQVVDYLGFQINSRTIMIKLLRHKIKDLMQECKKASLKKVIPMQFTS